MSSDVLSGNDSSQAPRQASMDNRRYYGLDALRGAMMMLGIVLHASMFYLVTPPPTMPLPTDRNNALVFDLIFAFIHSFRMPTCS